MANQRNTGGRVTKAERREQARRERLELQRKISRSRRNRRIAFVLVLLVAAGVTAFALTRPSTEVDPGDLLERAAQAEQAAGCGEVENVGPYQPEAQDQAHVTTSEFPELSTYPSVPPASGPHNEVPLGAGVYDEPPPIDQLIHSLEHGAVVVWYTPGTTGEELDRLREFFRGANGSRVIVAPYDYPEQGDAGRLPSGTQMALVAWHNLETCARVDLAAAFAFAADYGFPTYNERQYRGEAPEAGAAF